MLSKALARGLALYGIHYAWVIVALAFLFGVCASATLSIPGVLLVPMSKEFGWSIGDLSSPLGLRLALFGLVTPFAGGLMRLYGLRAVLIGSATLLIGGLLVTIHMTALWQMWLSLGIILGIATGMTSLVLASTIATVWFETRRGLVLGILSAGTATGQLIFLPLAAWLSDHYGWRAALVPSIAAIATLAAIVVLFFCDHPSKLGLRAVWRSSHGAITPPRG